MAWYQIIQEVNGDEDFFITQYTLKAESPDEALKEYLVRFPNAEVGDLDIDIILPDYNDLLQDLIMEFNNLERVRLNYTKSYREAYEDLHLMSLEQQAILNQKVFLPYFEE